MYQLSLFQYLLNHLGDCKNCFKHKIKYAHVEKKFNIVDKTVIVVDDNKKVIEVISELLTHHSFKVLGIGGNGSDAVQLYKIIQPDFVIMDVEMPDYDGFYGLEEILKMYSNAKIIMISTDEKYEQKTLGKAVQFLVKPHQIIDLPKILDSI